MSAKDLSTKAISASHLCRADCSPPLKGWPGAVEKVGLLKKCLHWYIPLLWRGGRRSLTGWLWWFCTRQLPSTVHDGTFSTAPKYHHQKNLTARAIEFMEMVGRTIPLLWRGVRRSLTGWLWWFCTRQLPSTVHDGTFSTAPKYHHQKNLTARAIEFMKMVGRTIPFLWRGVKPVHFAMHAFSNHVEVLHNVTPIDLPVQSAVLSDGVVSSWDC